MKSGRGCTFYTCFLSLSIMILRFIQFAAFINNDVSWDQPCS